LSASQFIQPHKSSSLYGLLSSWCAFTHRNRCCNVDSFMVSTITVTMSTSSLYRHRRDVLCCVRFTRDIAARLSTHFKHLLLDSIL
jgi:hypothetical protein